MSQAIVQEIINDILTIDPDLKNIKSELEKLIQELITNKPQTPFTKEFKDALKAQIIGAINKQKILYEEKKWDRNNMFHSIKFWMIGVSSLATCLLVFALFEYFTDIQQPATQITYIQDNSDTIPVNIESHNKKTINEQPQIKAISDSEIQRGFRGGASNEANNVMMLAIPEASQTLEKTNDSSPSYAIMTKTAENSNAKMAIAETVSDQTTTTSSPTFCETSKQFLTINNLLDTSDVRTKTFVADKTIQKATKDFTYDNQIYQAIVDYSNNKITIKHIGTQDDNKIQKEIPNLNLFFKENNFNIESDYSYPIIEETDSYFEYYYPRHDNQEGITVHIDKTNNIIFSIQDICIYK